MTRGMYRKSMVHPCSQFQTVEGVTPNLAATLRAPARPHRPAHRSPAGPQPKPFRPPRRRVLRGHPLPGRGGSNACPLRPARQRQHGRPPHPQVLSPGRGGAGAPSRGGPGPGTGLKDGQLGYATNLQGNMAISRFVGFVGLSTNIRPPESTLPQWNDLSWRNLSRNVYSKYNRISKRVRNLDERSASCSAKRWSRS